MEGCGFLTHTKNSNKKKKSHSPRMSPTGSCGEAFEGVAHINSSGTKGRAKKQSGEDVKVEAQVNDGG